MALDRNQAEAAAQAIMSEAVATRQEAEHRRKLSEAKRAVARRRAPWVLAGLAIGALVGHSGFGNAGTGAIAGVAAGLLVAAVVIRRVPGRER